MSLSLLETSSQIEKLMLIFACGVKFAAPVAFNVRWRSNSNVDEFDSQ